MSVIIIIIITTSRWNEERMGKYGYVLEDSFWSPFFQHFKMIISEFRFEKIKKNSPILSQSFQVLFRRHSNRISSTIHIFSFSNADAERRRVESSYHDLCLCLKHRDRLNLTSTILQNILNASRFSNGMEWNCRRLLNTYTKILIVCLSLLSVCKRYVCTCVLCIFLIFKYFW